MHKESKRREEEEDEQGENDDDVHDSRFGEPCPSLRVWHWRPKAAPGLDPGRSRAAASFSEEHAPLPPTRYCIYSLKLID